MHAITIGERRGHEYEENQGGEHENVWREGRKGRHVIIKL